MQWIAATYTFAYTRDVTHFLHNPRLSAIAKIASMSLMPSPLGHALGGAIAGRLMSSGPRATGESRSPPGLGRMALFAGLGVAPDLDLLFGTHSTYSHSIGAVAFAGAMAYILRRPRDLRFALACAAAWGSHVVLDWLGADATPPLGVMALWPFTNAFYQSPVPVFMAISRRYWQPEFYSYNARAVLREVVIVGPLAWLVWTWTRGREHR
jgi:membrane-bound metal-dependent hydrolase YbcI (DUF457 family)